MVYTYNIQNLSAGDSAVSRNIKTFTIYYNTNDSPISPVPQTQVITITATSGSTSEQGTFVVSFESPCQDKDLVTITATTQSATVPASDSYTSTDMTFTYNAFQVVPSYCDLTVTCRSVSPSNANVPCQNLDSNGQATWNFTPQEYIDRRVPPGTYTVTFDVTASNGDADLTESFDVVITLVDPCVNLVPTLPNAQTVEYTITDVS